MCKQGMKPKVCLACDDLMRTGQMAPATSVKDDPPNDLTQKNIQRYLESKYKREVQGFINSLLGH